MKKLTKEEVQKRVLKGGEPVNLNLFEWDAETNTFSSREDNLIIDFSGVHNCIFNTSYNCTFKTGSYCTFNTGPGCIFNTGSYCTFNAGSSCIFNASYSCIFKTGSGCIFKTWSYCTFNTGSGCIFKTWTYCTFNTGSDCIFETYAYCTFKTGSGCTFKTGSDCTFKTGSECVILRRGIFEIIQPTEEQKIQSCPYNIKGYLFEKNNKLYYSEDKENEYIIVDSILSRVIYRKGNVLKVVNYNEDKESYIIKDGDLYSHGKTIKEARESLVYKISSRDTSAYKDLTLDSVLTKDECIKLYRVITGACENGTKYFVSKLEPSKIKDKYSIKELIELTEGQYGNLELKKYFKF